MVLAGGVIDCIWKIKILVIYTFNNTEHIDKVTTTPSEIDRIPSLESCSL